MINPRRPAMHPQPEAKRQVKMTNDSSYRAPAPNPDCTMAEKTDKQRAPRNNVLGNPRARATNVALAGTDPAARGNEAAGKHGLFGNPQARTTNVTLAGLIPTARLTGAAGNQSLFANAQARETNVLLAGLHPPAPTTAQPRGWKVTETKYSTIRVTSTGTYTQQRVKDISIQEMVPTQHQGPVVMQTVQRTTQRTVSTANKIHQAPTNGNPGPVRRSQPSEKKPQPVNKDIRTMIKRNMSINEDTVRPSRLRAHRPASPASPESDTGTVIGPLPTDVPKRNHGKFRRSTVLGLFPGQEKEAKK
ncbi:hypothetical protein HDK90DRAFT_471027 [Phyllosticta capitalensis]|uniref:Uncharacterized protein n=1 Tax=Phyllosticta capitalensis TaxID=121624 RepID=A0ABR1Y8X7_9PEZI